MKVGTGMKIFPSIGEPTSIADGPNCRALLRCLCCGDVQIGPLLNEHGNEEQQPHKLSERSHPLTSGQ